LGRGDPSKARDMIRVLLAEDHPIVRDVLRHLLEQPDDIELVAMERNGEKAVNQAIRQHPDVAVLDLSMPIMDGIEATKEILMQSPETRVLILSGFGNPEYIRKSIEAGASGYVLKDFLSKDLISGVRAVYEGRLYFSQQIAEVAKGYMTAGGNTQ
jgi:DNA-binding NarL/FixJ family response regulator